jgi:siroheme synthase|tara:strand:+ start:1059 stop:1283 length:225 start_codon:yes stop_codon:yes gene_type:complete
MKKIFLIGAGPGDKDLITIKAVKILNSATVVLVDDLVNPEILEFCSQAIIFVGDVVSLNFHQTIKNPMRLQGVL